MWTRWESAVAVVLCTKPLKNRSAYTDITIIISVEEKNKDLISAFSRKNDIWFSTACSRRLSVGLARPLSMSFWPRAQIMDIGDVLLILA